MKFYGGEGRFCTQEGKTKRETEKKLRRLELDPICGLALALINKIKGGKFLDRRSSLKEKEREAQSNGRIFTSQIFL